MTPEQARDEIRSRLWAAADSYFEALAGWEKLAKAHEAIGAAA